MKIRPLLPLLAIATALLVPASSVLSAAETKNPAPAASAKGKLVPVTDKDAAWVAKAKQTYPLTVCVASDEKLDKDATAYIYREEGKPDRLVLFCCDGCNDDFMKEPEKFLAKMDAAAKSKAGKSKH